MDTDVLTGPNYCCQLLGYREMGCLGRGGPVHNMTLWNVVELPLPPTMQLESRWIEAAFQIRNDRLKAAQMTEPEKWK